jgi:hypothetical protein
MDESPLFTASVPVLLRYLESLRRIVGAVEALPNELARGVLLARLAPDMLSFHAQAETAVQFARRTAFPLAGKQVPPFVPAENTFEALYQKIKQVSTELRAFAPSEFKEANARVIAERAGNTELRLPAEQFLHEYALPNFFFHLNMAYAIARANGAALGKGTYDGFHVYASGA